MVFIFRYYLFDVDSGQYLDLKFTGTSSDSIVFSLVEHIEDAAKFKYEENAEGYSEIYSNLTGKEARIVEIYKNKKTKP